MREASHEKGRRQLMGFMSFLCGLPTSSRSISEIANSYETAAAAVVEAADPRGPTVHYDGVARIAPQSGPKVTCYIESKFCGTPATVSKLPGHLNDFLADAYCVLEAWSDDLNSHLPNFLFVSNAFGSLRGLDQFGGLKVEYAQTALAKNDIEGEEAVLNQLLETFGFVHYSNWLQELSS